MVILLDLVEEANEEENVAAESKCDGCAST